MTIFELTAREMKDDGPSVLRLQIDSLPKLKPNSNGETKAETQGSSKGFSNSATPAKNLLYTSSTIVNVTLTSHQCNHIF
jgi:hypothetical protein